MGELEDAYDEGVREAQAFIDRHPHGYPAVVMGDDKPESTPPESELDEAHLRGWFERLAEEIGTEEDPEESWKQKIQAFDLWPDWIDD